MSKTSWEIFLTCNYDQIEVVLIIINKGLVVGAQREHFKRRVVAVNR